MAFLCGAFRAADNPEMKMKSMLKAAAIAAALLSVASLGGCATFQSLFGTGAANDALKSAQIVLTTYADVYQPAVLAYGALPACPQAPLCHDPAILHTLKAADARAVDAIGKAQCVIEGTCADTGQLAAAVAIVQDTEASIAKSGALKP
jgi:hypothetical protein